MDEDEREQTRDDVDIMREQIEHLEACLTASAKECAAKEAEIQRLYAVEVEQKMRLAKAEAEVSAMTITMSETNLAMLDLQRQLGTAEAEVDRAKAEYEKEFCEHVTTSTQLVAAEAAARWCCDHLRFEPHNWALSTWPWLKESAT